MGIFSEISVQVLHYRILCLTLAMISCYSLHTSVPLIIADVVSGRCTFESFTSCCSTSWLQVLCSVSLYKMDNKHKTLKLKVYIVLAHCKSHPKFSSLSSKDRYTLRTTSSIIIKKHGVYTLISTQVN